MYKNHTVPKLYGIFVLSYLSHYYDNNYEFSISNFFAIYVYE